MDDAKALSRVFPDLPRGVEDSEIRNRLVAILEAGEIPIKREKLQILSVGVTAKQFASETWPDRGRRQITGLNGGLWQISLNYKIEREVFAERFPSKAQINALKKHAQAIERQLRQEWFRRHLSKFSYLDPGQVENTRQARSSLERLKVRGERREPETYLFASLYDLFLRLGPRKPALEIRSTVLPSWRLSS